MKYLKAKKLWFGTKIKNPIPYCIFVTFEVAEGQDIDVYSKVVNKVKTTIKP